MSFCLKNHICLPPSLCYSVFKTTPSVTPVLLLLCLQNYPVSFVFMLLCLKELSCFPPSLCYSVFKTTPSVTPVLLLLCLQNYSVSLCLDVILSSKTTLSGYLYYYIYPACDRLFCVVPLHRHQE